MWQALVGAGLGALKGKAEEQKYQDAKKVNSTTARWSPWTGMKYENPVQPVLLDSIMQGMTAGMMMGQSMGKAGGGGTTSPDKVAGFDNAQNNWSSRYA
jgi:hypothetical protein